MRRINLATVIALVVLIFAGLLAAQTEKLPTHTNEQAPAAVQVTADRFSFAYNDNVAAEQLWFMRVVEGTLQLDEQLFVDPDSEQLNPATIDPSMWNALPTDASIATITHNSDQSRQQMMRYLGQTRSTQKTTATMLSMAD